MGLRTTSRQALALGALAALAATTSAGAEPQLPPGFQAQRVISGLEQPVALAFGADGRALVAEKGGRVLSFATLPTPGEPARRPGTAGSSVFVDLSDRVQDFWDRGLLGLAVAPSFPLDRRVFVLYTRDAIAGSIGAWGDGCPSPPGATADGCTVDQRLSVLTAGATTPGSSVGPETVLVEGWCAQYPSHAVGALRFGNDGMLYASAGDGASADFPDTGNGGGSPGSPTPANPCGDDHPGDVRGAAQTGATAEGGALRAQDLRTAGDPVSLSGTVIRVDPLTGLAPPTNPLAGSADPNARRVVAYGLRNPFRLATRPGSPEIWLGDVGSERWEEINVIPAPTTAVPNFGWPCEEGPFTQSAFAGIALCDRLVTEGSIAKPYFTYEHGGDVAPGDVSRGGLPGACPSAGDSVTGLAFVPAAGTRYPAGYQGALVFSDMSRGCMWAIPPGANGLPNQARIQRFATGAHAVDLVTGPGGDLYYVDVAAGEVRRIRYVGPGLPPQAVIQASPTFGPAPLTVAFDATGSSDPDSLNLAYAWDLDDDGLFDDSAVANPTGTFATGDAFVHLRVTDPTGLVDVATVKVQSGTTPPEPIITAPTSGVFWRAGQRITATGFARDREDGTLPSGALAWSVEVRHCERDAPTRCHVHLLDRGTGSTFGFPAPAHDFPSTLVLRLKATDSRGLTAETAVELLPLTAEVTYTTRPAGGALTVGNSTITSRVTRPEIVGSVVRLSAPATTRANGVLRQFTGWSDGITAPQRSITVPDAGLTIAATLSNSRPVVRARWSPATGAVPATVRFDASASTDPDEGDRLTFEWDLDGDSEFDDATGPSPVRTFRRLGTYRPTVRVTDLAGESTRLPTEVVVVPRGTIAGALSRNCKWRASYFRNDSLRGKPVLRRCELALLPSWGQGRPTPRVRTDGFSARWVGAYRFPGGRTRFEVSADDGMRIYIDGKKVFDRWDEGAYSRYVWVTRVRKGIHVVRVEYVERTGGAYVAVGWKPTIAPVRSVRVIR